MKPPAREDTADDDDALMMRLQGGEARAFDQLYERYQSPLWAYFFRNTRDAQLAEDLAQETFLKLHARFWDYLPSGRFKGWLFRIAHNLLIDDVRRKSHDALLHASKHQAKEDDDHIQRIADDLLPPDVTIEKQEVAELIERLLDEIPADQRETFCMHHFQDLSLPDIADAMEVPLATCKSRLRLAREKLSEKLVLRGFTPAPAVSP
jgi:RNA polymerase sigma-70 factor (ECF subfamily)